MDSVITDPVTVFNKTEYFNTISVDEEVARKFGMGQFVPLDNFALESIDFEKPVLITHEGNLIALCNISSERLLKPEVVIADAQRKN